MKGKRTLKIQLCILSALCLFALLAGLFLCVPQKTAEAATFFGAKNVEDLRKADPAEIAKQPKYSSRDYSIVSTVKNQGSYSLCWAFATYAASETSMLREGLAVQSYEFDLEERVLAYRAHNPVGDPFHLIDDDVAQGDGTWNKGGYVETAGKTLLQWRGPTMQYFDANDETAVRREDYAVKYKLENMVTVKYSVDAVKLLVAEYGAAAFSFPIHNLSGGGYTIDRYFNNAKQSGENPHACAIIGWDDTIPASQFTPDRSTVDGGWIVKNSWGSVSNDGGYFYLSYDSDIYDIWAFDYAKADAFDNQYLYNGTISRGSQSVYGEGETVKAAAIYSAAGATSKTTEQLNAVNIGIAGEDVTVKISVYTGLSPDFGYPSSPVNDPEKGTLAVTQTETVKRDGYYTFYLKEPVPLDNGDAFSVVVEATSAGSKKANILGTADYYSSNDMTFECKASGWSNLKNRSYMCAHIRAYTKNVAREEEAPANDLKFARISLSQSKFTYTAEEFTPEVTLTLDGATLQKGRDYTVRYEHNVNALEGAVAIAEGYGDYTGEARAHFFIAQAKEPSNKPDRNTPIVVGSEVTHTGQIPLPVGWEWFYNSDLTRFGFGERSDWAIKFPIKDGNYIANGHDAETGEGYVQAGIYVIRESDRHEPVSIEGAQIAVTGILYYAGQSVLPALQVVVDGYALKQDMHFTVSPAPVAAGRATVTVQGIFTFKGSKTFTFDVGGEAPPALDDLGQIVLRADMKTLADVTLPSDWKWVEKDTPLTLGSMHALCEYTGADAENYPVRIREIALELVTAPPAGGGDTGDTGNTGGSGNAGDTGNTGGQGNTGNTGGNSGETPEGGDHTGDTGNQGNQGNTGGQGDAGSDRTDNADDVPASGLSPAAIAGIAVGSAAGIGLLALGAFLFLRRRKP